MLIFFVAVLLCCATGCNAWSMNEWIDVDPNAQYQYCPVVVNRTTPLPATSYLTELRIHLRTKSTASTELNGNELLSSWLASIPATNLTLGHGVTIQVHLHSIAREWFDRWRGTGSHTVELPMVGQICVNISGAEQIYVEQVAWSARRRCLLYFLGVVFWTHADGLGRSPTVQIVMGGLMSVLFGVAALMTWWNRSWNWRMLAMWVFLGSCWGYVLQFVWTVVRDQLQAYYLAMGVIASCLFITGSASVYTARGNHTLRNMLDVGFTLGWTMFSLVLLLHSCPTLVRSAVVTAVTLVSFVVIS